MKDTEFINWLKREELFFLVEKYYPQFKKIFSDCMKVVKEHVLIILDLGYPTRRCAAVLAGCYLLAAKRLNLTYKLVVQDPKYTGQQAHPEVIEALLNHPSGNIICLALSGKLGSMKHIGKSFRTYIANNKHRFVSTPGLRDLETKYFSKLASSIDVDYAQMRVRGQELKKKVDFAETCQIMTDKGTNLTVDIHGKRAISNDGEYSNRGGNMPSGEVYFAPRGKRVEGVIVIDGTLKHNEGTIIVKEPIKLKISNGEIIDIQGGEEARILEKTFIEVEKRAQYPWGIKRVGEIGIGINPGASLIPLTIVSEKAENTAHVGIGSNTWFGGTIYAISHFDEVFKNPRVYLDNKKINY